MWLKKKFHKANGHPIRKYSVVLVHPTAPITTTTHSEIYNTQVHEQPVMGFQSSRGKCFHHHWHSQAGRQAGSSHNNNCKDRAPFFPAAVFDRFSCFLLLLPLRYSTRSFSIMRNCNFPFKRPTPRQPVPHSVEPRRWAEAISGWIYADWRRMREGNSKTKDRAY